MIEVLSKGCCQLPLIVMRAEPSERSEMTSQMLFGEIFTVIELRENWIKIKSEIDDYSGWCSLKSIQNSIITTEFLWVKDGGICNNPMHSIVDLQTGLEMKIPAGSIIPSHEVFTIDDKKYQLKDPISVQKYPIEFNPEFARAFIHAPYLWGGKTIFGIDCSGFTQVIMRIHGYYILRDASQQVNQGKSIAFIEESLPGDLAFFDNSEGNITHTGIILDNQKIIHASGYVRIDKIDNNGIYDVKQKKYTHTLRTIKRIMDNN